MHVSVGDEQLAVDIMIPSARSANVTGVVLESGEDAGRLHVTLTETSWMVGAPREAAIDANRRFVFGGVTKGRYVIRAYRDRSNPWEEGSSATAVVTVNDEDLDEVSLVMSAGGAIRGRVTVESGAAPLERMTELEVAAVPPDTDTAPPYEAASPVGANGEFVLTRLSGSRYVVVRGLGNSWAVSDVRVAGRSHLNAPIEFGGEESHLVDVEVSLTDRVTECVGVVVDDANRPSAQKLVMVFSSEEDSWFRESPMVKWTFSNEAGEFVIAGLPSGSYYAAAVNTGAVNAGVISHSMLRAISEKAVLLRVLHSGTEHLLLRAYAAPWLR